MTRAPARSPVDRRAAQTEPDRLGSASKPRSRGLVWRARSFTAGCAMAGWIAAGCMAWAAFQAPRQIEGNAAGEERRVAGMKLCWCPAGRFLMGSPPSEPDHRPDENRVQVRLTRGFWMAKYETTQADWKRVMGPLPAPPTKELPVRDDLPVGNVNYAQAEEYCRRLTERARNAGELPPGWEFRLPTEAQWEYACRAGTTSATAYGAALDRRQANFAGACYNAADAGPKIGHAAAVGSYPPNRWGLCDMHGNTYEWCRDWYHARLPGGVDPDLSGVKGTRNGDGTYSRVRRGGAWGDDGAACRSARRLRFEPERGYDHIGFRIALVRH